MKRLLKLGYFTFFFLMLTTPTARAYLDPATTSYIIQIVAAFFITIGIFFSMFTTRAKLFLTKIKMKILEEHYKRSAHTDGDDAPTPGTLQSLVYDRRSWKSRLLLAAICSFALAFTFIIFGSYDLSAANKDYFSFILDDMWLPILLAGLAVFAVLTLFITLLRGKLFDIAISVSVGVLLAGYLQGNFLNLNLGVLTGDAIVWQRYTSEAVLNTLLWIVIISVPACIAYFSKLIWKAFCTALPLLLIVIQTVALITFTFIPGFVSYKESKYYLSDEGLYEMSSKENVIVFLLDRLDNAYLETILTENPNYFDDLDGFTRYTNNTSLYCRTYPSVVNMFTGEYTLYDIPADDFVTAAYEKPNFLKELRANDFTVKLFMERYHTFTDSEQLLELADNVKMGSFEVDKTATLLNMLNLSAVKYVPHVFKPSVWMETADFMRDMMLDSKPDVYMTDDYQYYRQFLESGISLQDEKSNFMYWHLNGSHEPFVFDENIQPSQTGGISIAQQTMGCFNILRAIFKEMKELGIYDNANIIITGDHGKSIDNMPLANAILTGLFVKRAGETGTPLQTSDVPTDSDNFRGTIMKMAGLSNPEYPAAYWEVDPSAPVVRKYFYRVDAKPRYYLEEFEIDGNAALFENWTKITEHEIRYLH